MWLIRFLDRWVRGSEYGGCWIWLFDWEEKPEVFLNFFAVYLSSLSIHLLFKIAFYVSFKIKVIVVHMIVVGLNPFILNVVGNMDQEIISKKLKVESESELSENRIESQIKSIFWIVSILGSNLNLLACIPFSWYSIYQPFLYNQF